MIWSFLILTLFLTNYFLTFWKGRIFSEACCQQKLEEYLSLITENKLNLGINFWAGISWFIKQEDWAQHTHPSSSCNGLRGPSSPFGAFIGRQINIGKSIRQIHISRSKSFELQHIHIFFSRICFHPNVFGRMINYLYFFYPDWI